LNNSNKVLDIFQLSKCGITGTLVDCRILFAVVLRSASTSILLAQSSERWFETIHTRFVNYQKIKEAAKLFSITVLDHIILTGDAYYSFAGKGDL